MKNTYPIIIILLLLIISPVTAELTVPDLEKIDKKIRESNNDLSNNLKEHIDSKFENIDNRFENIDNRFENIDNRFDDVQKNFDRISRLILGLLAGVIALALTPIGFLWWYVKRGESSLSKLRNSAEKSIEISKRIQETDRKYVNDMKKHTEDVVKSYKEFSEIVEKAVEVLREMEDIKMLYLENLEKIQES